MNEICIKHKNEMTNRESVIFGDAELEREKETIF